MDFKGWVIKLEHVERVPIRNRTDFSWNYTISRK